MEIILNASSAQPIYEQIVVSIKEAIMRGELKEGDPLPSMRRLAKDLHVSVITTQRAYEELEKAGFLVIVPAKGAFVAALSQGACGDERWLCLHGRAGPRSARKMS